MFKKVISLFFAICMMVSVFSVPIFAANPSDAKDSVVMVYSQDSNGDSGWGSGFAIGDPDKPIQFIATNCHVVTNEKGTNNAIKVYFSAAANKFMNAEIYWKNAEKDLAVLRLPEPTTERRAMVFCTNKKINLDDNFAALGYPWSANIGNDFIKFDKNDISITKGGIQKQTRINSRDVYLLDLTITQGNSGGPLVNSKGEVVGVNTFGYTDPQTKKDLASYAVAIDELMRNIDRNVIPYTVSGEISTKMIIYIILSTIVIIVIIVSVIILLLKKKKLVHSYSNAKSSTNQSIMNTKAINLASKAYIRGLNGYFAGQSFDIGNKLVIGRDSSRCTVVFPLDTAGVSGIHCEITFDGSTIYLNDLGSSYGTFLSSGTKLNPNTPIKISNTDKFYLGDEGNTFEFRW